MPTQRLTDLPDDVRRLIEKPVAAELSASAPSTQA